MTDDARHRRPRWALVAPLIATVVLGAGALAGCGSSSSSSTAPASSSSASSSGSSSPTDSASSSSPTDAGSSGSSSGSSNEQGYLDAIHTQGHFTGLSDAQLLKLGHAVCNDFAQGASVDQVVKDAVQGVNEINSNDAESGENPGGSLTDHDAGFLIGASVKGLCPQYLDKLQGAIGNS